MTDMQIIPAILATTEKEYKEKLDLIESSESLADGWVQIDLMDNKFVQNQSIEPNIIAKYPTKLKLEAQLMVEFPEGWIDQLVKIPVNRILFPIEDSQGIEERITHIKNHANIEVGLSLNPETPIDEVKPFLDRIDLVLVMSVEPGFGGQEFIRESIERVKVFTKLRSDSGLNFIIEVDGGINENVVRELVEAGVDNLVIGSHLLKGDIDENLAQIWQKVRG